MALYFHGLVVVAFFWSALVGFTRRSDSRSAARCCTAARAESSGGSRRGRRPAQLLPYPDSPTAGSVGGHSMLQEHESVQGVLPRRLSGRWPKIKTSSLRKSLRRLRLSEPGGAHAAEGGSEESGSFASPHGPTGPPGGSPGDFFGHESHDSFVGPSGSEMCPRCKAREKMLADIQAAEKANKLLTSQLRLRLEEGFEQRSSGLASSSTTSARAAARGREWVQDRAALRDRLEREKKKKEALEQRREDFNNYAATRESFAASNEEKMQDQLRREQEIRTARSALALQMRRQEIMQPPSGGASSPRHGLRLLFRRTSERAPAAEAQAAPPAAEVARAAALVASSTVQRSRRPG